MNNSIERAVKIADNIFHLSKVTKEHIRKAKQNDVLIVRHSDLKAFGALQDRVLTEEEFKVAEKQPGAFVTGITWFDEVKSNLIVVSGEYLKDKEYLKEKEKENE